jgi:FKBP-type peptidyl-prolyl cis-trans isomerase 2/predicted Fe-Mo cluster-binding NifX family protein
LLIAVPSEAPGGLDAQIAEHFGHCDVFTLVEVNDDKVGTVTVLENEEHQEGGCMAPVMRLKDKNVEAMVAGGMGQRPLAGFQQVGITVYFKEDARTVREAIDGIISGKCREFGEQHTCGGGEGTCGHDHHHHGPDYSHYVAVDGPVEDGRLVRISYQLFDDADGKMIDSAEDIAYMHGDGQLMPGFEKNIAGKVTGDSFEVTLAPGDCYGERDEDKVLDVPQGQLPAGLAAGTVIRVQTPQGAMPMTVLSCDESGAKLDANHPLAGKTIRFKVSVLEVLGEPPVAN